MASTILSRMRRDPALRLGALLLSIVLAGCGGGVALGFSYVDYDDEHHHPDKPRADPGIFLIAGGLLTCLIGMTGLMGMMGWVPGLRNEQKSCA